MSKNRRQGEGGWSEPYRDTHEWCIDKQDAAGHALETQRYATRAEAIMALAIERREDKLSE